MLRLHHEAKKLVEPEVVATSPYPGKNRMPVCCGFDSMNLVLVVRFALTLATFSTSCLCWLGYTSKHLRLVSSTN